MKINQIVESGTTAGSIATVAKPLGELQVRGSKPEKAPKVKKGRKFANTISEGAMKELLHNLKYMDANEFQKVYKKTKDFFQKTDKPAQSPKPSAPPSKTGSQVWHDTGYTDKKAAQKKDEPIKEDELNEEDLIILPGMLKGKDKSFISKEHDRRDHEVEMARSDLYAAAKNAMRIFQLLKNRTEDEGLMGWQQSYITLAADYLNSVADSLEYDTVANENVVGKLITKLAQRSAKDLPKTPEVQRAIANHAMKMEKNVDNAVKAGTAAAGAVAGKAIYDKGKEKSNEGAGVIAGGMSNFEESRPYNPLDYERREQSAMDQERRDFKRREMDAELAGEEERARKYNQGPWYVRINGKIVKDKNKQPYTFDNLEVARKAAQTMMKKDWNQGKQFSYSRSPTDKKDVAEGKCVECGGPSYSEESIAEAKDACYNKVKSRYKVWPSAYASGALVKCRKVGASNWGNKSKK
jgi:hypothetical protein